MERPTTVSLEQLKSKFTPHKHEKVKTYHAHGIGDGKFHFALFRQKREAIHECGVLKTICKD